MALQLEPASPREVAVYQPYYAVARRQHLALAVGLYKKASLEGQRAIEGEEPVASRGRDPPSFYSFLEIPDFPTLLPSMGCGIPQGKVDNWAIYP